MFNFGMEDADDDSIIKIHFSTCRLQCAALQLMMVSRVCVEPRSRDDEKTQQQQQQQRSPATTVIIISVTMRKHQSVISAYTFVILSIFSGKPWPQVYCKQFLGANKPHPTNSQVLLSKHDHHYCDHPYNQDNHNLYPNKVGL